MATARPLLYDAVDVQVGMGLNRIVVRDATRNAVLFLLLSLGLAACARGGDVTGRGGQDGGRPDGSASGTDAETGVCDPPCDPGETCALGRCVPSSDADGDFVDDAIDCDDEDPTVGSFAEADCEGLCGPGLRRCEDGVWGECAAPTSCDCEAGTPPRTVPCGSCGTQQQVCVDGTWQNDGACMGAGACSPGDIDTGGSCGNCGVQRRTCDSTCTWGAWTCEGSGVCAAGTTESEMQSCGACGTGSQSRTRTCDASCSWGAWGAWGTCSGGGSSECTAGATETRSVACGNCGTQTQTRTCSSGCTWGAWTNTGSCTGEGVCAPGATSACSPSDSCGERVCTSSCTWSACQPIVPGGCLRRRSASQPEGSNYRCCPLTSTDDGWQFCLPTCEWSTLCEATTSC